MINNLAALRAAVDEDAELASALPKQPRRNFDADEYEQAKDGGYTLFDDIYQPLSKKLENLLGQIHPDLGFFILQQEYGPLLAPPSAYLAQYAPAPAWEVGRVRTSLAAVSALRAQGGVNPQATSHVWGLLKARGAVDRKGSNVKGLDFLTTEEGALWTLQMVDEVRRDAAKF